MHDLHSEASNGGGGGATCTTPHRTHMRMLAHRAMKLLTEMQGKRKRLVCGCSHIGPRLS